jgi:hypothetical protein
MIVVYSFGNLHSPYKLVGLMYSYHDVSQARSPLLHRITGNTYLNFNQ